MFLVSAGPPHCLGSTPAYYICCRERLAAGDIVACFPTSIGASRIEHVFGLDWKVEAGPASNSLAADWLVPWRTTLATRSVDATCPNLLPKIARTKRILNKSLRSFCSVPPKNARARPCAVEVSRLALQHHVQVELAGKAPRLKTPKDCERQASHAELWLGIGV